MGFEMYDRAEEKYQAKVVRLTEIAVNVVNCDHDSFVRAMATAWRRADSSNKRIIWQAWDCIVVKYGLKAEAQGR